MQETPLRNLGDQPLGGEHEGSDRSGVDESGLGGLSRIDNTGGEEVFPGVGGGVRLKGPKFQW